MPIIGHPSTVKRRTARWTLGALVCSAAIISLGVTASTVAGQEIPGAGKAMDTLLNSGDVAIAALVFTNLLGWGLVVYFIRARERDVGKLIAGLLESTGAMKDLAEAVDAWKIVNQAGNDANRLDFATLRTNIDAVFAKSFDLNHSALAAAARDRDDDRPPPRARKPAS